MKYFLSNLLLFSLACHFATPCEALAEDAVFSGPQVGEKLTPFEAIGVFGKQEGERFDVVKPDDGGPTLLVFVHEFTRPSLGLVRVLLNYAGERKSDGLRSALVFLAEDQTEMTTRLKRAQRALPKEVPVGISVDGREGPGAYGLNRNVSLTILVGDKNTVTGNFAIVQPSIQADAQKVLKEVVKLIGGKVPSLAKLDPRAAQMRKSRQGKGDLDLRSLLAPVIRKDASDEQITKAAEKVETYVAKHADVRAEIGRIARRIIAADKLGNYGTPKTQEFLTKWAREFQDKPKDPKDKDNE